MWCRFCCVSALILSTILSLTTVFGAELPIPNGLVKKEKLNSFIEERFKKSISPGLTIVVVDGEDVTIKTHGTKENENPIDPKTLYEIGSTSKSYTAVAIMLLSDSKLIDLNAPVRTYIPDFNVQYKGKPVDVTINQLLHHTSGIPFSTIDRIPISGDENALKETVSILKNQELDFYPGKRFSYATINYDILGLVIENVTGKSFESFMRESIFLPLKLENTFASKVESDKLSQGYKMHFGKPKVFNAPEYKGNTPAGYIITNGEDAARWLKIQIGTVEVPEHLRAAIQKTQIPNRTVPPIDDGSSYASGWNVFQIGNGVFSHGGENPNFSSFYIFRPKEQFGVAVLSNMNSNEANTIGNGIMDLLMGEKPKEVKKDFYQSIDLLAYIAVIAMALFTAFTLWLTIRLIYQIRKEHQQTEFGLKKSIGVILRVLTANGFLAICIYMIPSIMFDDLSWGFLFVWAPKSFSICIISILIASSVFGCYYTLNQMFYGSKKISLYTIVIFSVLSGLGNATIIFIINQALYRIDSIERKIDFGLLFYFIISILVYIIGQKSVRKKLIQLTNQIVCDKRVMLIEKILNASYQEFEKVDNGNLIACVNNDTEIISNFANTIITALANSVTLVCCFIYLGALNIWALAISGFIILIAFGLYFVVGQRAEKIWEIVRDSSSTFLSFLDDLLNGFKELHMSSHKKDEFIEDIKLCCETYKVNSVDGNIKFANVFIIGELLFVSVIGVVAFGFPIIFKQIELGILIQFVFIFLYMTGPIHGILSAIPEVIQVKISWRRIEKLEDELLVLRDEKEQSSPVHVLDVALHMELKNVCYQYKNGDELSFDVGPLNCHFKSGQITFITGGNGSGKSTLAKLITGLYKIDQGSIMLNGKEKHHKNLGKYYSAVFSDYHLFQKLYGVVLDGKEELLEREMKLLELDKKIEIKEGRISSTKLSTGQRKRIALLISHLEDKPICLFDEWAADQDPEYRKIFYTEILPELKRKGKCVIGITHDDRYFHIADQVIKMDMGKIL